MIRHIVGFRLKDGTAAARRSNAESIKRQLESLVALVPTIGSLEVGLELGDAPPHWDAVLVSDFQTEDDLSAYQIHPEHVRVVGAIDAFVADRAVIDYRV